MPFQKNSSTPDQNQIEASIKSGLQKLIQTVDKIDNDSKSMMRRHAEANNLLQNAEIKKWSGPKYIIDFPDKDHPHIPYYRVDGQTDEWVQVPRRGQFYYDPIEDSSEFESIAEFVNHVVDVEMGDDKFFMGACHRVWANKKRILKEYYGIEWHSVADLNLGCKFD